MSVKPTLQVPVGNNVYYAPVKMTVNDWWVVAGDRNIEMHDVRGARIVTTRYTIDWRKHLLEQARFLAITSLILLLSSFLLFRELRWSSLFVIAIFQAVSALWSLRKKSVEHTLELTTTSGVFEVAKSNEEWYLRNITSEIGKRLAKVMPSDVVKAVEEPRRSDLLVAMEPPTPSKPIVYKWTGVTIEPTQVTVYHRVFPVEDILRAEVHSEVKPISVLSWVGVGAWVAILVASLLMSLFWLFAVPMITWAGFLFNRILQEWRRTHKYTVVMETRNEDVILKPTANLVLSRGMASNINRIVKQHLLGAPVDAPQMTSGVPTERM